MDLKNDWPEIRQIVESAGRSSFSFSIATVDAKGCPHITPIGSLILRDDCTGYYFEKFPVQLVENLDKNNRVAVLAINGDFQTFWLEALSAGKFETFPGMRLMGTASARREATEDEIKSWQERVSFAEGLPGHEILWKNMKTVRDIHFDGCKPVLCGEMTAHLRQ